MAKIFDSITEELQAFIAEQPLFFVASAPLSAEGHVNLSPKGFDCFRILSPHQVAYLDVTGSGNETSAHLQENGRITLMFCAFQDPPKILRLYGRGRVLLWESPEAHAIAPHFPLLPGARQIIVADIDRVQTSCGFGVPLLEVVEQRDVLINWAEKKGPAGLAAYHAEKNQRSIDGLPTPLGDAIGRSPHS